MGKIKKLKKPKYKIATERKKALEQMQRYVCEREMTPNGFNTCITCGSIIDNAQGGHFISKRVRSTELVEENIHPQCVPCNCYRYGDPLKYRAVLMDTYGYEYVERLEDMRFAWEGSEAALNRLSEEDKQTVTVKRTGAWYHAIYETYKEKRRKLREE